VQPFIDPVTGKKIIFINRENEAVIMAAKFDMDKMEACLGGKGLWVYNRDEYGRFCKALEASPWK
jgi:hypothetical protein